MSAAGQAVLVANEAAAAAIRSLADGLVEAPPVPVVPAPGTGLHGDLSDGVLSDLQRLGSHMFSTGALLPDTFTLGFFGQGVEALGDSLGGDWAHLMDSDSPGYRVGEAASLVTVLGALRRTGHEALEEGAERGVREVRTPPPPAPRLRPNSEVTTGGRVFARTDADGNLIPVPREPRELHASTGDSRQEMDKLGSLRERIRPHEAMRHGTPPPNVRTKGGAAAETMRVVGKALEDFGG